MEQLNGINSNFCRPFKEQKENDKSYIAQTWLIWFKLDPQLYKSYNVPESWKNYFSRENFSKWITTKMSLIHQNIYNLLTGTRSSIRKTGVSICNTFPTLNHVSRFSLHPATVIELRNEDKKFLETEDPNSQLV